MVDLNWRSVNLYLGGEKLSAAQAGAQGMQRLLFDVGKDVVSPSPGLLSIKSSVRMAHPHVTPPPGRKVLVGRLVIEKAQSDLPEMALALRSACSLAGSLHGRQEEPNEQPNDRDNYQQLDQGKTV